MRSRISGLLAAAAMLWAGSASAVTVDGAYDAEYGAEKSTVTYAPGAPTSNFSSPTPFTDAVGYNIYLTNTGGIIYGFLQQTSGAAAVGAFSNLYFGNAASPSEGSVIGFEITNKRAFEAGSTVYVSTPLINFVATATTIEFSLPESYFTSQLGYIPLKFAPGDVAVLRLSQTFGYSVAGGDTYGPNRLGAVQLSQAAAVPGPLAGAGLMPLLGLAGAMFARRRREKLAA